MLMDSASSFLLSFALPDFLLLLTDLLGLAVQLSLKPGDLPLLPHGDLRLLSHKLGHVHLVHSSLSFLSDHLVELNVIIISVFWPKLLRTEDDNRALESLEVVVTAMVLNSLGLVSLLGLSQEGVICLDS